MKGQLSTVGNSSCSASGGTKFSFPHLIKCCIFLSMQDFNHPCLVYTLVKILHTQDYAALSALDLEARGQGSSELLTISVWSWTSSG